MSNSLFELLPYYKEKINHDGNSKYTALKNRVLKKTIKLKLYK